MSSYLHTFKKYVNANQVELKKVDANDRASFKISGFFDKEKVLVRRYDRNQKMFGHPRASLKILEHLWMR